MHTPKLIIYLRTFSKQDWKDYTSFAKSVYGDESSQAQVITFYKKKSQFLHQLEWGRDRLLSKISPTITAHALANVFVKLTTVVEQYFIWQETKTNNNLADILLLENLAKRSLKKEFFKLKEDFIDRKKDGQIGLWDDFYQLRVEHLTYVENMTADVNYSRSVLDSILDLSGSFYDDMLSFYKVELTNREVTLLEDWSKEREKIKDSNTNNAVSELSRKLISLKKDRKHDEYLDLKDILLNKNNKYSKEITYTLLIHLTSYLNNRIKSGNVKYSKELLSLYIMGLDSGLLINNGSIPALRFSNILNIACGLKEYAWAEEFVDNYVLQVDSPNIEETRSLAKAEINFKKGDFPKVISDLVTTKYKNFDQELKARWLLICSEFELNRDNVIFIEDRVRSMRYYLKRNQKKVDIFAFNGLMNLCNFLVKLCKPFDKFILQNEIKEAEYLIFRNWLLTKVKE